MLKFKEGVSLRGMVPQLTVALRLAEQAYDQYRLDTVVTSVNDSVHSTSSYHYLGRGFDLRTKHAGGLQNSILHAMKASLNPLGFDVILEDAGGDNEHIHVELDKGRAGY